MATKYNDFLYKRGYAIINSKSECSFPKENWGNTEFGYYKIYYDKLNPVSYLLSPDKCTGIFTIGTVLDLKNKSIESNEILRTLLNQLIISEEAFFELLDYIAGRYVIFYLYNGHYKIIGDAASTKPVFYSKKVDAIASHANLLNDLFNHEQSDFSNSIDRNLFAKSVFYLPCNYTFFNEIYFLTTNTLWNITTSELKRFYPRKNNDKMSVKKAADKIIKIIDTEIELLNKKFERFNFSLTAGIDTRTKLSFFRNLTDKLNVFTYEDLSRTDRFGLDTYRRDVCTAGSICSKYNMKHTILSVQDMEDDSDFTEISEKNNPFSHYYKIAKLYQAQLENECLHLRSNTSAICKSIFLKNIVSTNRQHRDFYDNCALLYYKKDSSLLAKHYEHFLSSISYDQLFNYNPYDMFFWEIRETLWYGSLNLESDIAFDTFELFSNRMILSAALSVPYKDRIKDSILKRIVSVKWGKELLQYGINMFSKDNVYNLNFKLICKKRRSTLKAEIIPEYISNDNQYAFYIFKDGQKVETFWYTDNPIIEYNASEPGNYQIMGFLMRNSEKNTVKGNEIKL